MTDDVPGVVLLAQGGIRLLQHGMVGLLMIEREARRNSLDNPALEAIIAALDIVSSVRLPVCIIASQGTRAFCAGSDLKALVDYDMSEKVLHTRLFQRAMAAIDEAPCATIASIEGYCLGGGLELALGCDRRIASAESVFGFPEVRVGALPTGGGTLRAPRAIGMSRARDMLVFGDRIDASTAHAWGLVGQICQAGEALSTALACAEEYAARVDARSIAMLKQLIHGGFASPERATQSIAVLSDELLLSTEESRRKMSEGAKMHRD